MKVAILTPVYADTSAEFTFCLGRLLTHSARQHPQAEIEFFLNRATGIAYNRCILMQHALDWGADWTLWIDADMTFPPDAFSRLHGHGREIVGCNYSTRDGGKAWPTAETGERGQDIRLHTTKEKADAGLVEPATALGLGLCLVSASVYPKLRALHASNGIPDLPVFNDVVAPGGGRIFEDRLFFWSAADVGVDAWLDHGLSWEVGHVGVQIYRNADTMGTIDEERAALAA